LIDVLRHLDTATAYFLAGERCALDLRFGRYKMHSLSAPTITNYALSVELALKLIYVLAIGGRIRGHNLQELFDALPDESRKRLPHLSGCVLEIAQYFENWQYAFEKDLLIGEFSNPRRAFIECFAEIRRLRPDLLSFYEAAHGSFQPDWLETASEATSFIAQESSK
jgi:HEPN domain-containing protein